MKVYGFLKPLENCPSRSTLLKNLIELWMSIVTPPSLFVHLSPFTSGKREANFRLMEVKGKNNIKDVSYQYNPYLYWPAYQPILSRIVFLRKNIILIFQLLSVCLIKLLYITVNSVDNVILYSSRVIIL